MFKHGFTIVSSQVSCSFFFTSRLYTVYCILNTHSTCLFVRQIPVSLRKQPVPLWGKSLFSSLQLSYRKNCRLVKEPAAFQGSLPRTISTRPPCIFELSLKTFASEAFCLFTEFLHGTSLILTHRPDGSSQKTWLTHTTPGT